MENSNLGMHLVKRHQGEVLYFIFFSLVFHQNMIGESELIINTSKLTIFWWLVWEISNKWNQTQVRFYYQEIKKRCLSDSRKLLRKKKVIHKKKPILTQMQLPIEGSRRGSCIQKVRQVAFIVQPSEKPVPFRSLRSSCRFLNRMD